MHTRFRLFLSVVVCLMLALAPGFAQAKLGGSMRSLSQGSRGLRTFESDGARPFDRSMTMPPATPRYQPAPGYANPSGGYGGYGGYGYGGGHPFLGGLAGGFLGAGLSTMLFGQSYGYGGYGGGYGYGGGFAGLIGHLFKLVLLGGLAYWAFNWFRRGGLARASTGPVYRQASYAPPQSFGQAPAAVPYRAASGPDRGQPIEISDADLAYFGELLVETQRAWSQADLSRLSHMATPEMISYFKDELAENESRGVRNRVENVHLVKGDLLEAWAEGSLEYATARLSWTARDYTVRADAAPGDRNAIVGGTPDETLEETEIWTFMRGRSGGRWLLSAIQQIA